MDNPDEVVDYQRFNITGDVSNLEIKVRCKCDGDAVESAPSSAKFSESPLPDNSIDWKDILRIIGIVLTAGASLVIERLLSKNPALKGTVEDTKKAISQSLPSGG